MTIKTQSLDELFDEEVARLNTPERRAQAEAEWDRAAERRQVETQRLIASGKLQPDGEPWPVDEAEEEEEEDEEEDEEDE
jgi:hypothetical protein